MKLEKKEAEFMPLFLVHSPCLIIIKDVSSCDFYIKSAEANQFRRKKGAYIYIEAHNGNLSAIILPQYTYFPISHFDYLNYLRRLCYLGAMVLF